MATLDNVWAMYMGLKDRRRQAERDQVADDKYADQLQQQSLGNMAQYMADLQDNGKIDSSALYAEGPKGTTIKVGGSRLSSLKQA